MSDQQAAQTRLRFAFGKQGPLRYTSHLDLARIWERLLRRAALNVVYSQGFNPRPKIQLAAALPLGYTSTSEVLDVWLAGEAPPDLQAIVERLQAVAPEGLEIQRAEAVPPRGPALQTMTREAVYEITLPDGVDAEAVRQSVAGLLAAERILRERRDKEYDLRPLIHELEVADGGAEGPVMLIARLNLSEAATGRPDELLAALGLDANHAHVERVALHFDEPDGAS